MKIRPVGAALFHDRRTDGYDDANNRFSQFCERAQKLSCQILTSHKFRTDANIFSSATPCVNEMLLIETRRRFVNTVSAPRHIPTK